MNKQINIIFLILLCLCLAGCSAKNDTALYKPADEVFVELPDNNTASPTQGEPIINTPEIPKQPTTAPTIQPIQTPIHTETPIPATPTTEATIHPATDILPTEAIVLAETLPTETIPLEAPSQTETISPKEETPKIRAHKEDDKPLTGIVIGIDAGHQKKGNSQTEPIAPGSSEKKAKVSSGTAGVVTKTPEHKVNLSVALKLRDLLVENGATVVMVRETEDVDISNSERAKLFNDSGVDLGIRIHCNGSESSRQNGALMLVPAAKITSSINETSEAYAKKILKAFVAKTDAKNNGIIKSTDMTGFNWSTVPVCIIEMGFMSNENDDKLLSSDDYQSACAKGILNGVLDCFEPNSIIKSKN